MSFKSQILAAAFALSAVFASTAATWSNTELQFQHGELKNAFTDTNHSTNIVTFQHASGWEYGSNFFFFDYISTQGTDELYGELYSTFSGTSILGAEFGGPIRDIGFVMGLNMAADVDELKYLPGIQIDWNVKGFAFLSTMITAYIDDGNPTIFGIEDDNSWMIDVAWKYPFVIGDANFSIEGHVEYIAERNFTADFGSGKQESWILAQPQIRWDAGKTLFNTENKFHLGVELQYWKNKLGTQTDEKAVQLLAVWQL